METGIVRALEEIKKQNEAGLNYIYSQTYNYVYLRAKCILHQEEDVRKLMQRVYQQAYTSADGLNKENLYEWLGKKTYILGRESYRKKKAREMPYLEYEKSELRVESESTERGMEVIIEALEQLPDLYHATVFAFFYDYMKVETIAEVMDCTTSVILNRLNYARKYVQKAIEHYQEEQDKIHKEKLRFSVATMRSTLTYWAKENCLGITGAQAVYQSLCKELGITSEAIHLDGKEFAGVNHTLVYLEQNGLEYLALEIERFLKKEATNKKPLFIGAAAIVLAVALGAWGIGQSHPSDEETPQETEQQVAEESEEEGLADTGVEEPVTEEPEAEEPATEEPEVEESEEAEDEVVETSDDAEYLIADSDTRELTRAELEGYSAEELRMMRNEIYARHGMIFGDEELDGYFATKSWYTAKYSIAEFYEYVEMSIVEELNISLIRELELEKE